MTWPESVALLRHAASGVDLIVAQSNRVGGHTREVAAAELSAVVGADDARMFGHSLPHYGYHPRIADISATVGATGLRYLP
jgi:hypothetical protein